jgi:hypothetical protein
MHLLYTSAVEFTPAARVSVLHRYREEVSRHFGVRNFAGDASDVKGKESGVTLMLIGLVPPDTE